MTTAENGPRALEVLGLGDHQRNTLDHANVSDSMPNFNEARESYIQFASQPRKED